MFVDKETYERAGLPGKPYGPKGGRGTKPRWSEYRQQVSKIFADLTIKL